jgi:BolA protein
MTASVRETIENKLRAAFAPSALSVEDESARHAGHAGAHRTDGRVGETHFRVRIVSHAFTGLSRVARQRDVYAVLKLEIEQGVHALALTTLTPDEAA